MAIGEGEGVEHLTQATQLPEHNCKNCGACCGPVVATKAEIVAINQYVSRISRKEVQRLKRRRIGRSTCQFRDEDKQKCMIYPVRPEVCRLMGVVRGLVCFYGNSANLNGYRLLDMTKKRQMIQEIIPRRRVDE